MGVSFKFKNFENLRSKLRELVTSLNRPDHLLCLFRAYLQFFMKTVCCCGAGVAEFCSIERHMSGCMLSIPHTIQNYHGNIDPCLNPRST